MVFRKKLTSLQNIEKVGGEINLRYSSVHSLGQLKRVGRRLSLRDTPIEDLGSLEYVGGDLFLPKRMESYDISHITVKGKVRYWKGVNEGPKYFDYITTPFSRIHIKELKNKERILTGKHLVQHCVKVSDLNYFILKNIEDFYKFVDKELDDIYQSNYSFFYSLFGDINNVTEINKSFRELPKKSRNESDSKYFNRNKTNPQIKKYLDVKNSFKKKYNFKGYTNKHWVRFNESRFSLCSCTGKSKNSFVYFIENSIYETFYILIISLQNDFRVSMGLPRIGEGWVSETELFYLLKEELPNEKIIHHGKPKWLGRQHVDIWFPKHKIGIEYQGLQHDKPVDFFGGEEGFKESQKKIYERKSYLKKIILP